MRDASHDRLQHPRWRPKLTRSKTVPPAKSARSKAPAAKSSASPARKAAKKTPVSKVAKKTPAKRSAPGKAAAKKAVAAEPTLLALIRGSLEDDKAEDLAVIDLAGRSSLTDALIIASGRSSRHVAAIAEHLVRRLKEAGYGTRPTDGLAQGDWVLVDAGDVIVHVFRPEVRQYYDLEGMWRVPEPERAAL